MHRLRHQLQRLTPEQRQVVLTGLPDSVVQTLLYDWRGLWARDAQLPPPGNWRTWLILAGRGWGKTKTGAETVRHEVESGRAGRVALIGPTAADVRDVMVEGQSGIIESSPPWNRPRYEPSKRRVTWNNGARAFLYSSEEADRLRGPQHDLCWGDEVCSWTDMATWDMMLMGLRLGDDPRALVTTTPKPSPLLLRLMKDARTTITKGSTFDNAANLAAGFLEQVQALYKGTRLGRQELEGELLEDVEGAFFSRLTIDKHRRMDLASKSIDELAGMMVRIVVAVDPAPSHTENSDETGIVVGGLGHDGHVYVLEDCSMKGAPDQWASVVVRAFYRWKANLVVGEVNAGGDMVESVIHTVDEGVPFKPLRAMRGKSKRMEPVAALDEQGKVHHVGVFQRMEDQLARFTGINGRRDDRADARGWLIHELVLDGLTFAFA